jgi:HTH-type transcriptional regulator/antitoxin HigA
MNNANEFKTDWFSAPASTVFDILHERGLSLAQFISMSGLPETRLLEFLYNNKGLDQGLAECLSSSLGASPSFWMNRQAQFDVSLREGLIAADAQTKDWLTKIPVRELQKLGWVGSVLSPSVSCLNFFGVSSVKAWELKYKSELAAVKFRTSERLESDPFATLAWLQQGKILSGDIPCERWNSARLREAMPTLRRLTREKDPTTFFPELQRICSKSGVAVVATKTPKGCRASGATRFLSSQKAMVLLSFRFLSDDHFWFSFFHEIGHVILHDKNALFLEGEANSDSVTDEEQEANQFAEDVLIPAAFRDEFKALKHGRYDIVRFARDVGISPGIVVGQLQHAGRLPVNRMNWMKRRYTWS